MNQPLALIVEDNKDLAQLFRLALEEAGFATHVARSGEAALDWVASAVPDIVVLDLHLPRVPGTDVLRHLRSDPRLATTRVIITTGDEQTAELLREQVDLVLIKPIAFAQLRDLAARLR